MGVCVTSESVINPQLHTFQFRSVECAWCKDFIQCPGFYISHE